MTAAGRRALTQAVGLVVGIVLAFALLEGPFRRVEAMALGAVLRLIPRVGSVIVVGPSIIVFPTGEPFIRAVLLPSCSSLAPLLAMSVLWPLVPAGNRVRVAVRAVFAAVAVIAIGNFTRLLLSLLAGRMFGDAALVAFHDTVGAAFSYLYVIAGLLVGLRMLLPASPAPEPRRPVPVPAEALSC